jgi:hypothetical protein
METRNRLFVLSRPTPSGDKRVSPNTFFEVLNTCERQHTHFVRDIHDRKFWVNQDLFCDVAPTVTTAKQTKTIEESFTTEATDLKFLRQEADHARA